MFYLSFHFVFPFILDIFIKTIWMERFQLKLDWWLHCYNCEKQKKKRRTEKNIIKLVFFLKKCFFSFILVVFIKTIWMERFQLKLDWWLHYNNCEKKKRKKRNIHKNLFYSFIFFFIFVFPFILVGFLQTTWMDRFQLKLDWRLHYNICKKKKKEMKYS